MRSQTNYQPTMLAWNAIRVGASLVTLTSTLEVYAQSLSLGYIVETDGPGFETTYTNSDPGQQAYTGSIDFKILNQSAKWTWWADAHNFGIRQMELDENNSLTLYKDSSYLSRLTLAPQPQGDDYGHRISSFGLFTTGETGFISLTRIGYYGTGVQIGTNSGPVLNVVRNGSTLTNNVGIGTTEPTSKLHVVGDLNVTGSIINSGFSTTGSSSTSRLRIGGTTNPTSAWQGTTVIGADGQNKVIAGYLASSTSGAVIGAHNSALSAWADLNIAGTNLIFRSNETERMRLTSGGKVGLGTNNPGAQLHIASSGSGSDRGLRIQATGTGTDNYAEAHFAADAREYRVGTGGSGSNIGLANKFYIWDANGNGARAVIDSNGNVGLGTTAPAAKLQVSGDAIFGVAASPSAGTGSVTFRADSAAANAELFDLKFQRSNYSPTGTAASITMGREAGATEGNLIFKTNNGANLEERLRISAAGNVGVGTSTPAAKLDVNGAVQIAGDVKVKNRAVIRVSPAGDIPMIANPVGMNPEL